MAKKEKKKVSIFVVILNVFNALAWIATSIFDLIYNRTHFLSYIHYFCAAMWLLAAVIWIIRYRSSIKKEEPEAEE